MGTFMHKGVEYDDRYWRLECLDDAPPFGVDMGPNYVWKPDVTLVKIAEPPFDLAGTIGSWLKFGIECLASAFALALFALSMLVWAAWMEGIIR